MKIVYYCGRCGADHPDYAENCPACGNWWPRVKEPTLWPVIVLPALLLGTFLCFVLELLLERHQ